MFEGWSEARIRAYNLIETKPNSYYYRFNEPGEKQRNGAWSEVFRIYWNLFCLIIYFVGRKNFIFQPA